jgi:tetratricopeptide (TPR) repeat protein
MKMSPKSREELDKIHSFLGENGNKLPAINRAAQFLQQQAYPLENALNAYEAYLVQQPGSANAAFNHAWYLGKDGQFIHAIDMYLRAINLGVAQPEEAHLNIANIYMNHLGNYEKAREEFQKALALNPRYAGAYHNLGNLAEQLGDREQAESFFRTCLEIEPQNDSVLARLADAHKFQDHEDPLLDRLVARGQSSQNSDLHFALGAAFNQLADYDLAWRHFSTANALDQKALPPYNREQTEALFSRIMSQSNADWLISSRGHSHAPVFICGMFRTGSTLLEQVLAAHPRFTAGGESEFFPRLVMREFHEYPNGLDQVTSEELHTWRESHSEYANPLSGENSRLTDKRPDNFLYTGLIKATLPSAKFVVTERDWRDVALSIFSNRLGAGQSYSTSLADTRHYIRLQKRLVDHWASLLGNDLVRISYEDMVRQPGKTIAGLLQALGEEWDDRCLAFDKLDNAVKTASVWQVREPLHTKSIGRWKNYRSYFEESFGVDVGVQ